MISKLKGMALYIIILFVYFILLGILFSFFQNAKVRNTIAYEYEAVRGAFGIIEAFRQNIIDDDFLEDRGVISFGVYNLQGRVIFQWGKAPTYIDPDEANKPPKHFRENSKKQGFRIIQPIGSFPPHFSHMQRRMMNMEKLPAFLYMNVNAEKYFTDLDRMNFLELILIALITAVMAAALYFYHKLKHSQKILAQKEELARLGEISRTLSHEIKNPLGAMRIQTGLLKKTTHPEHHPDILLIEEEIDRLSLLTRRIGDFVRDPLGQDDKIELKAFINNTIKAWGSTINFKNLLQDSAFIIFDKDRLRSVIENLIQNAFESHDLKQEHAMKPELILKKENNYYIIAVLDRGTGLPQGHEDKIFDPAFSSKSFGSGIGLSIAKRFVEARGGKIILQSRDGGGTEAHIILKSS